MIFNMFNKIILIFFLTTAYSASAEVEVEKVTVFGYGNTRVQAVQSGLIEAIKQRKGVSIDVVRNYERQMNKQSFSINDVDVNITDFNNKSNNNIEEVTSGTIQNYNIINIVENKDNEWEVQLEIIFKKYRAPGITPHGRRKIAIMPFRTLMPSYKVNSDRYTDGAFSKNFNQHLTNHLTQSRRFTVLDREYIDEYLTERAVILSNHSSTDEQVKLGEALGADYIVVGKIGQASIGHKNSGIDIIGKSDSHSYSAEVDISYRIIALATRQVKWSDTVSLSLDADTVNRITYNKQDNAASQAILSHFASIISNQLISNIYPLRVVGRSADRSTVTLNQGGKTLAIGDKLQVMSLGSKVIDPYNGEYLGQQEHVIATIEVVRILPKMSMAKLVTGSIESINELDIVRRIVDGIVNKDLDSRSWRKSNTTVLDNGGVILPFD
jgi:curli biogenesis system outer membrane secretion channel CsgG